MKVLKYPLVVFTVCFAVGIALNGVLIPSLFIAAVCFCIAVAASVFFFYRKNPDAVMSKAFGWSVCGSFVFAGMLATALHNPLLAEDHYSSFMTSEKTPVITGVIRERLKPNAFAEKYFFDVKQVNSHKGTGRILISIARDSVYRVFNPGDKLAVISSPQPIHKPLNPYGFDYSAYMRRQGVYDQLYLKGNFIKTGTEKDFTYYVSRSRNALIASFDKQGYDPVTYNVIKALLFGQRQDMDQATTDSYTNAGVIHVIAISGLHFAVLFFIFNLVLRPLERSRRGRILHFVLMMVLMWGFAFVAGLSASVVRSVVMFSFISLGTLLNRHSNNTINSVATSMLILLLANPDVLFDVGFQLSYAAVIGILWIHPVIRLPRSKHAALNATGDMATVSLAAQIGVLPLTLYYFHQFPLLFLIANLVVIPLSNVVLVLGIITLLLNFIWVDAALWAGKLLGFCIHLMNKFAELISHLDSFLIKDIPFTPILMILLYAFIGALIFWLYKRSFRRSVALLSAVLIFQLAYGLTALSARQSTDALVLHNRKQSLILVNRTGMLTAMSNDTIEPGNRDILSYRAAMFCDSLQFKPLKNLVFVNGKKILITDRAEIYDPSLRPDILILRASPKVNLERLLAGVKPKAVVADGTNYKSYIARWKATCRKLKIPFHATAEKGFYAIR